MKWPAVLFVVAIAIDGLPALNLPLGSSSDPSKKTSSAIDVGVGISKAGGVTLTNTATREEHLRKANQQSSAGRTVSQSADGTSSSQADLENRRSEELEQNSKQEDTQALSVLRQDGLLQSKQTSRKSGDASKTQEEYQKEKFSSHDQNGADTRDVNSVDESGSKHQAKSSYDETKKSSFGLGKGGFTNSQSGSRSDTSSVTNSDFRQNQQAEEETSHKGGTTKHRESLSESVEGSEDSDEFSSHSEYNHQGPDGTGNQGLLSGIQARSSLAHRGPIRAFSHKPNHGPSEAHAYNQHRNYASENGHYGSRTRHHGGDRRHIRNLGTHNGDHGNGFWNHAYNSEQLARGAGHHHNNHFLSGTGIRHQGASSAEYINHGNDASQFSEGLQGADANEDSSSVPNHGVNIVDLASDTENQETNSKEYESGNVSDESVSKFESSGYVDKSFRRGPGKGVNTDKFVSEPQNEGENSGQYGSKVAGSLKELLNKHFISGHQAHFGKYNAIARHGNGYQGNANGDQRRFLNRPHFENQRVNPGKYINGIFGPTDNINYGSGNRYHSSRNEYFNGLLNRARGRLSYSGPVRPRPVPGEYMNGGFAQGGYNDHYDIEDDEEESQEANADYISDILTQAQHLLKHGAVPNNYGVTPGHHHHGPHRRPVYETPNLGIRFYDTPTGSYMANPASTADDDDTYGGVAPGYVVPAVIVPEFNGYPNGQYYGPNYYSNGDFGSGPSYIPGIDRSGPTTIFGRNPSVLPLSTISVSNVANVDNPVAIDKTLIFESLPPLNPFKPLSPLIPLTPLSTFDNEYGGTSGDASEIIIDKDLLRETFKITSSLENDAITTAINKDLTSKITQTTHSDSYNDENSKIDNGVPTDKNVLPKQTGKPVKGNEKIDEVLTKITKEKTDDDKLVASGKDDDKTIVNPGKSIIIDKNTVTKHIYNHGDVSKKDKTVKIIEKVLETNEKSRPIEKKDDATITYDKSNGKTTTKKGSGKNDKPNSNDNDEISKTGKSFVIDKSLVINTINKDKSVDGKDNKDQTSTKTREVPEIESESENLDKSDEGTTTNGKSIVVDETTAIKLTGKDVKDFVKNDIAIEVVKQDLGKVGSHVIGKTDDKTTKPVRAIVIQNNLGNAKKSDITNNDVSTKNGKTSDKNTEIKNADKDRNGSDKKDKTLGTYNKSDDIGKINDVINKNGKSTVTENTDNQGKDNVKTPKTDANVEKALETDDTSKPVHKKDNESIKNGESIAIGKSTVVNTIHKGGTETIDKTSTETKEVVGNDGNSDSNDKSNYETTKNSKSKENNGLKDSDRKSKTVEKIKKPLRKHDKLDDISKDNDGNTKLVKTIVIDKDTVIKNFLKKDDRDDDKKTTKKGKSKVTEDTDKDEQVKNKTDNKIDEKDDRPDTIAKQNDNATKHGKSIGIKNTTLIEKDSRKDDVLDNIDFEKTTKNGKSTAADKSWGVKKEKKITKKVSGTDDESNKNNDVDKTTPGKSTVTDNSSAVKTANNDGEDETPEADKSKGTNIKSVTKDIKKGNKDDKLTKPDKTSDNGYTRNDDKKNFSDKATKKAVGSGNDNGSSDEDFHADNFESGKKNNVGKEDESESDGDSVYIENDQPSRTGKGGKSGSHGSKKDKKEVESHKSDRNSINEDNVRNENDQPSRSEKDSKSGGHGSKKDKKEVEFHKRDGDSINEDGVDNENNQPRRSGKGGKSGSQGTKKDKKEVGSHKSDGDSINEDSVHNENDQPSRTGKGGKSGSHGSKKDKKEVESHKSDRDSINEDNVRNENDQPSRFGKDGKSGGHGSKKDKKEVGSHKRDGDSFNEDGVDNENDQPRRSGKGRKSGSHGTKKDKKEVESLKSDRDSINEDNVRNENDQPSRSGKGGKSGSHGSKKDKKEVESLKSDRDSINEDNVRNENDQPSKSEKDDKSGGHGSKKDKKEVESHKSDGDSINEDSVHNEDDQPSRFGKDGKSGGHGSKKDKKEVESHKRDGDSINEDGVDNENDQPRRSRKGRKSGSHGSKKDKKEVESHKSDGDSINKDSVHNEDDQPSRSVKGGKSGGHGSKKDKKEVESHKSDGDSINKDGVYNENNQPSRSGKGRKSGSHGSKKGKKEVESHKSDGDSINEDSVDNEYDKSPSNVDDQVVGSKNDLNGTSGKDDKSESKDGKEKRIVGSKNDDDADSNEIYSKGGKTQSNDDRNVVKFQKEDALRKSDKEDENSTKTDQVVGRKNDHKSDSENIGNNTTSEDDKLTGIAKETVSVKTNQDDNTNGSQDQNESGDDSSDGSSYENSRSREYYGETDYDDIENDDTSNDEHQENGTECGDDSNNEDRDDDNENVLFGKTDGKKFVGSETGENEDSNENFEDASSDSAKSHESGESGVQKDNKVETDDAPEKSGEDGKHRKLGNKKVVGSEKGENKDSDEDDKDAPGNSNKSGESRNTDDKNDKTVVGSEYSDTSKKSGADGKSGNNSAKKDENVVEPENRNNKDFHENAKDASNNSEEDGKSGRERGHKRRNHTNIGKVVGDKNPRDTDSATSENDGTSKDNKLTVTSEKPKTGKDENNDTEVDGSEGNDSSNKKHDSDDKAPDKSDNKSNKFRRNGGHKRNHHTTIGKLLEQKELKNNHETDSQSTESNKTYKSGQDKNDDTKRDESDNGDSSINDNITDKSDKVDQSGSKRGHKRRNHTKAGTTVGHKNQNTDSSNSDNEETSKDVKLTATIETPKPSQDKNNESKEDGSDKSDSSSKEHVDGSDDDITTDKSVKSHKIRRNGGHKHKNPINIGKLEGENNYHETDSTNSVNDEISEADKLTETSEKLKSSQDENNNTNAGDGSIIKGSDNNNDDDTSDKGDKSGKKHGHKRRIHTKIDTVAGHEKNHKIDFTKIDNDETSKDDKFETPKPSHDDSKKDRSDKSDSSIKEQADGSDDDIKTDKSVKSYKIRRNGGLKHKNPTKIEKLVGESNGRETDSTNSVNNGNSEDDKITETSEKPKYSQDENNNTNAGDGSVKKGSDNNDDDNTSDKGDKSGKKHGHKRRIHTNIRTVAGDKKNRGIDSTKIENVETSKDDKLTVTSEKPKPGQDENNNTNAGDGSIKKGSDNNDDDNKSDKGDKSGKKHGYQRRIHTNIGTVAGYKKNLEIDSAKSADDEISKNDKLTVTSESLKTGQDENNDGTNDESKNKDSDDDNTTGQSDKGTKSRKNDGQKHKIITKIGTTVVNKNVHETDDESTIINEKPKSSKDENNDTKHVDSSVLEDFDDNDDDKYNKRDTSEKRKHERKPPRTNRNKIDKIFGLEINHETELTDSENNEASKKVKSIGNNDNKVSDKTDFYESNEAKVDEGEKKVKKVVESGTDTNNDDDDIVTHQSGKSYESVGKGDKNDGENLGSDSGENVNLDEDGSEKSEKEIHGRKHKKSHKFVGRKGQKKYRETDLSNNNNETFEGVKSTEINENPVSDKPGEGKNNSDKKAATESDSDDYDEGKLSDNYGKGGRNGSSQDKAVGPETGDSKTPNEYDDDNEGVIEKGGRIHVKKHKKSHKIVGRKVYKKNHDTDLLNIDNTETSEGVKSTDIKKKSTSDKPGQEENKNDENEKIEKKINRSGNGEHRENSDDDEDELSKKSGKGGRLVKKDKKVTESKNDTEPEKSDGGISRRHGGKHDKATEIENGNKAYTKEHNDVDKDAAEKSNKGGRTHGKEHKRSHNIRKVVERKGLKSDHVTNSAHNENDGVSKQVKSTVDGKKPVSDENSEDQKDVDTINKEVGFEKGDRLTNGARDGETNEDGEQTVITEKRLRIRDYRRKLKNNKKDVTKTKKDLQPSNVNGPGSDDSVDDGGEHSNDSKLTDQNSRSVNIDEKHKIRTKIVRVLQNHESGDHSDSETTEKSKLTSNSEKAITEETDNNDKNDETSTTNDVSGHEDETCDDSNSAVKDKQFKTKKHNRRDTTNDGNKDTSSQVIRKLANTKDKDGSITDANASKDKASNEKDSSSDSKNNLADDNEQQDNEFKKDSTNNSNADETTNDSEQERTAASSESDDAVSKNTDSEKEDTSGTKNTAVTNTSKPKPKIHRRTTDIATKTRNLIKRKLATITITIKQHKSKVNTEDTNNNFAGKTTADSTSGKTTETDDEIGKTEETSNKNTADNSSDNYDKEKSSSTITDNKKEKRGSQSDEYSSSSTNSEGDSKTSSTDPKKESSNNQSDESSNSSNDTAGRQTKDETKSSYKSRKEEFSKSASGYGSGAEQQSLTKDGKKTTYKQSSKDSAHSEQQEDSKYTEESRDSKSKTVQSEQKSASEEGNINSSDSYVEESDGKTKNSEKDTASAEDKKNQAFSSSEYKKVDSNGSTAASKSSSKRKSFKSKQSSSTDEEYSSRS